MLIWLVMWVVMITVMITVMVTNCPLTQTWRRSSPGCCRPSTAAWPSSLGTSPGSSRTADTSTHRYDRLALLHTSEHLLTPLCILVKTPVHAGHGGTYLYTSVHHSIPLTSTVHTCSPLTISSPAGHGGGQGCREPGAVPGQADTRCQGEGGQ